MGGMGVLSKFSRAKTEPPQAAPAPEPTPAGPAENAWIRVLVVDDNQDVREMLEMSLRDNGFTVVGSAASGAEAMVLAEEREADIILLDLHLPDVGGLDIVAQLRQISPGTKIVILSAISATMMTERAIAVGAAGFIDKGVSLRSISLHLDRVARAPKASLVRPFPLNRDYP